MYLFPVVITLCLFSVILTGLYHSLIYGIAYALPKLFALFIPTLTLSLGVGVICLVHPVHALLCLIAIFFNTVLLYLAAEAEFLALVFLIVYVGAIAILFLFVIRLLNVKELTSAPRRKVSAENRTLALIVAPLGLSFRYLISEKRGKFLVENQVAYYASRASEVSALETYVSWRFQDIRLFTELLYTYYSYLFRLVALLLLTARLGAIILATSAVDHE